MNGILSQLVTVCSAANGRTSRRCAVERLLAEHADFKYCHAVSFVRLRRNWLGRKKEVPLAGDPDAWLAWLTSRHALRAYLHYVPTARPMVPDYKLAGLVGGGGIWSLLVQYERRVEQWLARWDVTHQDAADQRIWTVTYGLVRSWAAAPLSVPFGLLPVDLPATSERLQSILARAESFAARHRLDGFGDAFRRAGAMLGGSAAVEFPPYVDFVCLECYSPLARRLFAAAYAASVFGGMGSWNDQSFEDRGENDEYEQISGQLYAALNAAVQSAANSFGA
jgi:hypothetical protein